MMLRVNKNGGLPLYNNLKDFQCSNMVNIMKTPTEIFENKLNKIVMNLKLLDEKINGYDNDRAIFLDSLFEKSIFDYIQSIDELYDVSFLIKKSLSNKRGKEENNAKNWCNSNEKDWHTSFVGAVDKYHNSIRIMSNKIKHDSLTIGYIELIDGNKNSIKGFYFSDVLGAVNQHGPNSEIHKNYKGSPTAFSFNHFIKFTVGFVFYILEKLNDTIFNVKKIKYKDFYPLSNVLFLINLARKYDSYFFPDEYSNGVVSIKEEVHYFNVHYPQRETMKFSFDNFSINYSIKVSDNSNVLPYFKLFGFGDSMKS